MLNINSIERGIVIDHIKCGSGYRIFKLLNLDKADYTVALIMNVNSVKLGKKDMIKIENNLDIDLGILGVIDEGLTINLIDNEKIIKKVDIQLPEHIDDVLKCSNPRCVTNSERNVLPSFSLVNRESKLYKCDYCDHIYNIEEE